MKSSSSSKTHFSSILFNKNEKFIFLFFSFILAFSANAQTTPVKLETAKLGIAGTTNINEYACILLRDGINDTVSFVSATADGRELFHDLRLRFRVADFSCNLKLMTQDFRATLKEKEFPYIYLHIQDVFLNNEHSINPSLDASVNIQIAGKSQPEYIKNVEITQKGNHIILSGKHSTKMTNFGITPPVRLLGSVRTNDTIEISFSIELKKN